MKKKDNVIKCLEMMGFEVLDNIEFGFIRVFLKLNASSYVLSWTVYYHDLEQDFSVERIVKEFTETLKQDF